MVYKNKKELKKGQIQEVQNRYAMESCSYKQLAAEFDVSIYQIIRALQGIEKWKPTVQERFNTKWIEDGKGCNNWIGYRDKDGYGQFKMNNKALLAHRASYLLSKGELPQGYLVRHVCDNPACVNPNHLILGTAKQNTQDKLERFRQPWQYSAIEYLEMRFLNQIGVSYEVISNQFGIKIETLKRRLKDMDFKANDSTQDKVFYYRGRAVYEEDKG